MIESGSLEPGIDPAAFRLPPATALRYERPHAELCGLIPSYAVFDSDPKVWKGQINPKLPGGAQLWIVLAQPIAARVRNRRYGPLGRAVVFGATSTAMPVTINGGVSVLAEIGPAGWARWFETPAEALRDQISPLDQLWPAEQVRELTDSIGGCGSALQIKARLDAFFLSHLPRPKRQETTIAQVAGLIAEGGEAESSAVAAAAELSEQQLRRITLRYFGFGPKMLIRRTRLLRAMAALLMSEDPAFSDVPPGYHSISHFHRDAREFLGTTARRFVGGPTAYLDDTPERFVARPTSYLSAMLRARTAVIGAPVPALDHVEIDRPANGRLSRVCPRPMWSLEVGWVGRVRGTFERIQ